MSTNIEKYKLDLKKLIKLGHSLHYAMQYECFPKEFEEQVKAVYKADYEEYVNKLPSVKSKYQHWYSEALVLIKQLLPDRINDFIRLYEKPKTRKSIDSSNYVMEDYLQGMRTSRGGGSYEIAAPKDAIPQLQQQIHILESIESRFESSLFDIKQLAQADILDSELDAAKELNKNKFYRAAGAIAGVVLEKHLYQVAQNHNITIAKKEPTINDLNEVLKNNNVIEVAQWRFIQHLGDIRNLCSHNKTKEPSIDDVNDLINGVDKIAKTVF